ncbi:hypothetical protein AVEN_40406-1 [Araneus ventricosus]|uniref:Uncharacterized protein n=1 Tax=Araneus ventricosus TaxID=182803 RepID=A0A4Y2DBL4_ARAVE|nr:hypothetical protein AVEN_40406-1 [Araneus ventricosus]
MCFMAARGINEPNGSYPWFVPQLWLIHGGLVVKVRLRDQRASSSEPDSSEDPPCVRAACTLNSTSWAKRPLGGEVRKFGYGAPAQVSPCHLTAAQNYDVRPKIGLLLLQEGTLI